MDIKEICNKDNRLQIKLLNGEISLDEFNFRKMKIHREYNIAINENKLLNDLIKKHGGI